MVCPASYVADEGEIVALPSAELTVTKSVPEATLSGVLALSVTL